MRGAKQNGGDLRNVLGHHASQYTAQLLESGAGDAELLNVGLDLTIWNRRKELAERMPREHYLFTAFIISFLNSVDELQSSNKMSAENLAIVFGPVLMKRKIAIRPVPRQKVHDTAPLRCRCAQDRADRT